MIKIILMKKLNSLLKDSKTLVFLDFEGTQLSQEIIAIGAVKAELNGKNNIKKMFKPFKCYVKCQNSIGPVVIKLTGITNDLLSKEGLSFKDAMERFKSYVGSNPSGIKFITYGNFDARLLHMTSKLNNYNDYNFLNLIFDNYIDFSVFFSKFVRSSHNEILSLMDALKTFNITPEGEHHDPKFDAINLLKLYQAFLKEKGILKEQYTKVILNDPKLPSPIRKTLNELIKNNNATKEDLEKFIEEEI